MIEFIKEILDKRRKTYNGDPLYILQDYKTEIEKIEEYNGRQLLEMLQNADDEAITNKEKVCHIKLSDNHLIIANNGKKFSKAGIESLLYSNLSPKIKEQNKVGQKGLGFRSILSWANKVTIKSYDFAVEFSKNNAVEFLKILISKNPEIREILSEKEKDEKYPIAILRCPKIIEKIPTNLTEFDTYIIIELKDDKFEDVQKQIIDEINKEVLLFLNNLEKIIIDSPDKKEIIIKSIDEDITFIKTLTFENEIIEKKEWKIKCKKGKHRNKNYELKVAWNINLDDNIKRIYSYFKTKVKFPFPALIHGTFELSSNRNELINDTFGHNRFLIDELIQLLIDTALEISNDEISYKSLELLSFYDNESIDTFFEENDFAEKLKEKIKNNRLFPSICKTYISYKDKPVFSKNDYASILPPEKFKNLLLFTDKEKVIKTINWLEIYSYNQEYLFKTISEISSLFNIEKRAKLIRFLILDYGNIEVEKEKLPNIFIDQNDKIIPANSEIYLPPTGEKIEIPVKLNLKIIHPDLFNRLKQLYGSQNAEVIENELKYFKIKVYRFGNIFQRIISDFNNKLKTQTKNRRILIKELHSHLYDLFVSNKDKEIDITIPSNISIPVLSKNNGETKINNVYLGKEYENKLCEILFSFDRSKLVGSPNILGINNKENIKEFLLWLGVAEFPIRKIVSINNSKYKEYVLTHFPYKTEKIYGIQFKSYQHLKDELNRTNEIKVETIVDIESILEHNSIENIIYWIKRDSSLFDNLNSGFETNNESDITLDLKRKQYYAHIQYKNIKSYIFWQFYTIKWLTTKTRTIVEPSMCCLSKTINEEFSPVIEIPEINYDHKLFKEDKLKKDDVDFYLSKIGVNKDISSFPTDTIYNMLLNLPELEKESNKAKLIYQEIIENLDEKDIDKKSEKYKEFFENGEVFCKKNNEFFYKPISDVFYIEDKTFGEDIINQFYTIEIERRKGAKKVKNIFCVKSLDKLEFILREKPVLHSLNDIFQNEIEELKPYIYAFRIAKDKDGKELNWIKNSRINLCVSIKSQYKHNEITIAFKLNPYEFIYIEKKNEIYLLINNSSNYKNFIDLQVDYKFSDVIAEIFSSIVKVDYHREAFSRIFEAKTDKRNYIIKNALDDKNLEKLKDSKIRLNIVDSPKIQFWFNILSAKNIPFKFKKYNDTDFEKLIQDSLDININDYNIFYEDYNDINNYPIIVELFKNINIDISDYNTNSTIELNIRPYFSQLIKNLQIDFQKEFDQILYNDYKNESLSIKETFIDKQNEFENYEEYIINNSIKVDFQQLFLETIKSNFNVDLTKTDSNISLDLDMIYKENLKILKSKQKLNINILTKIINSNRYNSLIYFHEFELILKEYETYLAKADNSQEIRFNNKIHKIQKDDLANLYELLSKENPITKIEKLITSKPEIETDKKKKKKKKGQSSGASNSFGNIDNETIGCIGEIIVFETLKKRYENSVENKNVFWDSDFAKRANVNPKGNDNKHYDIKYKNNYGKWIFVEVKTTSSNRLEFKISKEEVLFGTKNRNNYEIMIVTNAIGNSKDRKIKRLVNPFNFKKGESFTDNSKFYVKNDNFTIKLEEK